MSVGKISGSFFFISLFFSSSQAFLPFYNSRPAFVTASSSEHRQQQPHHRSNSLLTMSSSSSSSSTPVVYSDPDQPARFAKAKKENNARYLDITTVYDPSYLKGKRVAITGANRGIGLSLATELVQQGGELVAIVRSSSPELEALNPAEIITGIDVMSDEKCEAIASQIKGGPIDIVRSVCFLFLRSCCGYIYIYTPI